MKISREKMLDVYILIDEILKKSEKVKFNFRLFEEQEKIEKEKKRLEEVAKPNDKINDFERKRLMLCNRHCEKDENKKPIIENNMFKGLVGNKEFNKDFLELKEGYKEDLEKQENKLKEVDDLLKEEIEIKFEKINLDLIPDDIIDGIKMKKLKEVGIL